MDYDFARQTSLDNVIGTRLGILSEGYTIDDQYDFTMSGLSASAIKSTIGDTIFEEIWTFHNGKGYGIFYSVDLDDYSNYVSAFKQMADSFHITK